MLASYPGGVRSCSLKLGLVTSHLFDMGLKGLFQILGTDNKMTSLTAGLADMTDERTPLFRIPINFSSKEELLKGGGR